VIEVLDLIFDISTCLAWLRIQEEDSLQAAYNLAALRHAVVLLEGEVLLEGWAAEQGLAGQQVLGLLMVTNWRVAFADVDGGFTAFPIFKIDDVRCGGSAEVVMSVWYGRMHLTFDNAAIAAEVVRLLRQDPCWAAADLTQDRRAPKSDISTERQEVAPIREVPHAESLALVA
jgi:hypothetical protein